MNKWSVMAGIGILSASSLAAAPQAGNGPVWSATGDQAHGGFGSALASAGDVDGDGYGDVIVAAGAYDHGQENEGRVYLFRGSPVGPEKHPAWTAEFDQAFTGISRANSAGDVNGDGHGDVIVSSSAYSNGQYLEGKAWLFLGSPAGLAVLPAWSAEGDEQAAYFGSSAGSAGDVNGDGFGDVVLGASFGDITHTPQAEGAAFLYLGSAAGLSPTPAWSVRGNQRFSRFGNFGSIQSGDVNGDGHDDLAIGADSMNNGEIDEGRVFVYLGSPAGPSATPDWSAESNQESAYLGSSLGFADVDGDGYDDLVVAAPGYRSGAFSLSVDGLVVVYKGSATGLSPGPVWSMTGGQRASGFAIVAAAGDLDADGFDDVLLGAPAYDHDLRDEGHVAAFFGSPTGLRTRTSWIVEGDQRRCDFGAALAAAGDVNGDGFDDVILGAPGFDGRQPNEGRVVVYLGATRRRLP